MAQGNMVHLLLIIVGVLILGYLLVQLVERERSAVYVDDKVKVATLKDGCRTLLPFSFEFKGAGKYEIPGFGLVEVQRVDVIDLEYAKKHLIGPGGLPPQAPELQPAGQIPIVDDARYFLEDVGQGVVDVGRVPYDLVTGQGDVRQDLRRVGQDLRRAPGRTVQFIEDEVEDVRDVATGGLDALSTLSLSGNRQ